MNPDFSHGHNGGPLIIDRHPDDRMTYAQWHIKDFLQGVRRLKPDQVGLYSIILSLIYDHMGALPDDDKFIAGHCDMEIRYYRRIKASLVEDGKIFITDGFIYNSRALAEIAKFCTTARRKREAAAQREERKRQQAAAHQERLSGASQASSQVTSGAPQAYLSGTSQVPDARLSGASQARTGNRTGNQKSEILNEINDGETTAVPVLSTQKEKEKEKESPLPPFGPGFDHVGAGVWVNCETVRHAAFTLSIPAIAMQLVTANIMRPKTECQAIARDAAVAHALQWASEINAGRSPQTVVPAQPANFIRGSVVSQLRKGAPAASGATGRGSDDGRRQIEAIIGRPLS